MTAAPAPPQKKTFSGDVFHADAVALFVAYKVPITQMLSLQTRKNSFFDPPFKLNIF